MPPRKKEKSKACDWLQCSLCERLITPDEAEVHIKACDSDQAYILHKSFHGRVTYVEGMMKEDGSSLTKSLRNPDGVVWLPVSTMQLCGLSIGRECVVNKAAVKKAWPLKSLHQSKVAMTTQTAEELDVVDGEFVSVEKLFWDGHQVERAVLELSEPNAIFEKEEFADFAAAYLDQQWITEGTPLTIKYFGQTCHCNVTHIDTVSPEEVSVNFSDDSMSSVVNSSFNNSNVFTTPVKQSVHTEDLSAGVRNDPVVNSPDLRSDSVDNTPDLDLSNSLADLNISNTSTNSALSPNTPKTCKFPNLNPVTLSKVTSHSNFCRSEGLMKVFHRVNSSSEITCTVAGQKSKLAELSRVYQPQLCDVGGLEKQGQELKSVLQKAGQSSQSSHCVLVHGPPGTGKSLLVTALTSQVGLHTTRITGHDLRSKALGEAESILRKSFKSARGRMSSVLVIDDIDVICPKRAQSGQLEHRILGILLSLVDGILLSETERVSTVVVIGITNSRDNLDAALLRSGRFDHEIEVGVPTAVQRKEILDVLLKNTKHSLSLDDLETVARNAHGYVGADLAALVNQAFMHAQKRAAPGASPLISVSQQPEPVTLADMQYAGARVKPSALREIQLDVPQVRWSDIAGMSEVKMRLQEAVELPLRDPDVFERFGIEPPRGLLMYGPSGCSKTMVAKAVATEYKLNFLAVKGPELFNQYVGESEKAIREIFRKARSAAPSIIFFDEIDAIGAKRGSSSGSSGVEDRVLTQLLTEMDGLEYLKDVFIIAATNRPDKIDQALLRPGRFDSLVYVPLPNDETRKEILEKKLSRMSVSEDVNLDDLVVATIDYSGAEIVQVCKEAGFIALREDMRATQVHQRHFDEALSKVVPRVDPELVRIYTKFSSS